jgi:hypothetical protein
MATRNSVSTKPLFGWIRHALQREDSWTEEQASFLESILSTAEGSRALASLVATTLRLRATVFKPEQMGAVGMLLPSIEEFWNNPSQQTYQKLRIARW